MSSEKLPRKPSWVGLRDIVDFAYATGGQAIRDYLLQWPERLRAAVALALSCAHWSREARTGYNDAGWYCGGGSRFRMSSNVCGLCQQFLDSDSEECGYCPLAITDCCFSHNSLCKEVCIAKHHDGGFHKAADALYNKLVELYVEELRRLGYDA